MAVRVGMTDLILELRGMTQTVDDPNDVGNNWSDENLQTELDYHVKEAIRVPLRPIPKVNPTNTLTYFDYVWSTSMGRWIERPITGDINDRFLVQETNGIVRYFGASENFYLIDWAIPKIYFNADTSGIGLVLSCRVYDLNKAAANIWLQKAGRRSDLFNWKTDNHTMNEGDTYKTCMDQYQYYSNLGGWTFTRLIRTDGNNAYNKNWRW